MSQSIGKILLVTVCIAGVYGCTGTAAKVGVAQVFANANCQLPQGLSELLTPESLQRALAPQRALSLPASDNPPVPDFDPAARYFLVSLGVKSSGGYSIRLEQPEASIREQTVWIDMELQEPRPGMMTTQALTSPCMVFRVDRGDYSRLVINGQDKWALSLEPNDD